MNKVEKKVSDQENGIETVCLARFGACVLSVEEQERQEQEEQGL